MNNGAAKKNRSAHCRRSPFSTFSPSLCVCVCVCVCVPVVCGVCVSVVCEVVCIMRRHQALEASRKVGEQMRGGEQDRKKRSQSLSLTCEVCLPEARCTLPCFLSESSLQGEHRRDRTGVNTKPKSQALHL